MEKVVKKQLDYLREKMNNSKSRTEYNSYLRKYNELYLDWLKIKGETK